MQDVCISYWKEDGSSDMMLKVKDALILPGVLVSNKFLATNRLPTYVVPTPMIRLIVQPRPT